VRLVPGSGYEVPYMSTPMIHLGFLNAGRLLRPASGWMTEVLVDYSHRHPVQR
jgi:hypothetical protein